MKKNLSLVIAVLFMAAPFMVSVADAQPDYSKAVIKQMKKECKKKTKQLSSEKWEVFGSSHSLEGALMVHYEKLMAEGVTEMVGFATSTQKNIGSAKLLQDAVEKYASLHSQNIKGRTVTKHGSEVSDEDIIEIDNFLQGFDSKVQGAIRGELKPSFMIYRQVSTPSGKPSYEFEGYFLVDTEAAHQARLRAMEEMLKEQEAMHKLSDKTAKWIKEAFEEEEGLMSDDELIGK